MNGFIFYGSLQTWPTSESEAGTSTVSVPYSQHLGHEGMETAFLDSSWEAGTLLEEADGSNNCPGPRKVP